MNEVKVALPDRREFEADIVLRDPRTDLAVLRLKGASNLETVELGDSEALQVGDIVLAIGNPFGVGQTVTQGIVSALARTQVGISDYQFFIQTDAAINPGNSGGALIDMNGRLVGINTAIYSRSGGNIGIGFAVPSSMVRVVLNSAKGGARNVVRPWLGARLQPVDGEIRARIAQHDIRLEFPPVGERHLHLVHVLDHMIVRDDEARRVDDDAGAKGTLRPASRNTRGILAEEAAEELLHGRVLPALGPGGIDIDDGARSLAHDGREGQLDLRLALGNDALRLRLRSCHAESQHGGDDRETER
jgi:hypothetical protein